jgi:hypothetical protein
MLIRRQEGGGGNEDDGDDDGGYDARGDVLRQLNLMVGGGVSVAAGDFAAVARRFADKLAMRHQKLEQKRKEAKDREYRTQQALVVRSGGGDGMGGKEKGGKAGGKAGGKGGGKGGEGAVPRASLEAKSRSPFFAVSLELRRKAEPYGGASDERGQACQGGGVHQQRKERKRKRRWRRQPSYCLVFSPTQEEMTKAVIGTVAGFETALAAVSGLSHHDEIKPFTHVDNESSSSDEEGEEGEAVGEDNEAKWDEAGGVDVGKGKAGEGGAMYAHTGQSRQLHRFNSSKHVMHGSYSGSAVRSKCGTRTGGTSAFDGDFSWRLGGYSKALHDGAVAACSSSVLPAVHRRLQADAKFDRLVDSLVEAVKRAYGRAAEYAATFQGLLQLHEYNTAFANKLHPGPAMAEVMPEEDTNEHGDVALGATKFGQAGEGSGITGQNNLNKNNLNKNSLPQNRHGFVSVDVFAPTAAGRVDEWYRGYAVRHAKEVWREQALDGLGGDESAAEEEEEGDEDEDLYVSETPGWWKDATAYTDAWNLEDAKEEGGDSDEEGDVSSSSSSNSSESSDSEVDGDRAEVASSCSSSSSSSSGEDIEYEDPDAGVDIPAAPPSSAAGVLAATAAAGVELTRIRADGVEPLHDEAVSRVGVGITVRAQERDARFRDRNLSFLWTAKPGERDQVKDGARKRSDISGGLFHDQGGGGSPSMGRSRHTRGGSFFNDSTATTAASTTALGAQSAAAIAAAAASSTLGRAPVQIPQQRRVDPFDGDFLLMSSAVIHRLREQQAAIRSIRGAHDLAVLRISSVELKQSLLGTDEHAVSASPSGCEAKLRALLSTIFAEQATSLLKRVRGHVHDMSLSVSSLDRFGAHLLFIGNLSSWMYQLKGSHEYLRDFAAHLRALGFTKEPHVHGASANDYTTAGEYAFGGGGNALLQIARGGSSMRARARALAHEDEVVNRHRVLQSALTSVVAIGHELERLEVLVQTAVEHMEIDIRRFRTDLASRLDGVRETLTVLQAKAEETRFGEAQKKKGAPKIASVIRKSRSFRLKKFQSAFPTEEQDAAAACMHFRVLRTELEALMEEEEQLMKWVALFNERSKDRPE